MLCSAGVSKISNLFFVCAQLLVNKSPQHDVAWWIGEKLNHAIIIGIEILQPQKKQPLPTRWLPLVSCTASPVVAVTANWHPADVPRPGDQKISRRNGSGVDVATTFTMDTSKYFNICTFHPKTNYRLPLSNPILNYVTIWKRECTQCSSKTFFPDTILGFYYVFPVINPHHSTIPQPNNFIMDWKIRLLGQKMIFKDFKDFLEEHSLSQIVT
jgi:hypothetical protein